MKLTFKRVFPTAVVCAATLNFFTIRTTSKNIDDLKIKAISKIKMTSKNEVDLRNEDSLKNENNLNNEEDLEDQENLKN